MFNWKLRLGVEVHNGLRQRSVGLLTSARYPTVLLTQTLDGPKVSPRNDDLVIEVSLQ